MSFEAAAKTEDIVSLMRQKKYKSVVSYFDTTEAPKNYKEHAYLILAYKKLGETNKLLKALESAVKSYPKKEILVRELSSAYEQKANSFGDKKIVKKVDKKSSSKSAGSEEVNPSDYVKTDYYLKALNLLSELKDKNPSPENLTAFLKFLMRNKDYDQAEGILEIYSRTYKKGDTYYSFLCEVQFEKKFYGEAVESCEKIKDSTDVAFLRYFQAKERFEQSEIKANSLITAASRFPASSSVNLEIGKRLFSEGKFEESITHLKKANQSDPTGEAYRLIAESEFSLQNYSVALNFFKKACKVETGSKSHIFDKIRLLSKRLPKKNSLYEAFKLEITRCKHLR